mmetsp:Transcript_28166/g.45339  ORF Transcript_28166/g.45339 Transcript_28166/m.45339 type:complete len:712 (+) Transcript_28166:48-2183(+)
MATTLSRQNGSMNLDAVEASDSPRDEDWDMVENKNELVDQMMLEQRHEWTKPRELTIFCGTWNVNAKVPNENLAAWLCPWGSEEKAPDVYCIGIQEVVELNAMNIGMSDANSAKQSLMWEDKVEKEALKGKYTRIMGRHFVGLMMAVYVKTHLVRLNAIRDWAAEKLGVGKMGLGNKGAIVIRMNIWEVSICFVNTHLTAGKSKCNNRNQDFETIFNKMEIKHGHRTYTIKDHDYCFWVGDLNYRLNATDLNDVYKRIKASPPDMSYLLNADQLITERSAGRTFQGFQEQEIKFLPTYKYIPNTPRYDDREDGKRRMPAWCDRIQWLVKPKEVGLAVKPHFYKRAELICSDHKPVMALFTANALEPLPKKERDAYREDLIRKLDEFENEHIPQVSLSKNTIDLGDVFFDTPATDTLVVKNTGKAMAEYHFVAVPGTQVAVKKWVTVTPATCLLVPGASKELTVTAHVTREFAQDFNSGKESIDHFLILELIPGRGGRKQTDEMMRKSQFISVSGKYMKSCFGCSLDYLVTASDPVRSNRLRTLPSNEAHKIPKELWRIVDHLYRRGGLYEVELFVTDGYPDEVKGIMESLDCGEPFEKVSLHSMAETLVRFLSSLEFHVFSAAILNQAHHSKTDNIHSFCRLSLRQLNPLQYRVFTYVVSFIREILKHKEHNKLSVDLLVPVFAKCLFEDDGAGKAHLVLSHFLSPENNFR